MEPVERLKQRSDAVVRFTLVVVVLLLLFFRMRRAAQF